MNSTEGIGEFSPVSFSSAWDSRVNAAFKRFVDTVVSAGAMTLLHPFFGLAIGVKWSSSGHLLESLGEKRQAFHHL
jgi:hypothetical protein